MAGWTSIWHSGFSNSEELNPFPSLMNLSSLGIVADFGRLPTAPMAAYDRSDDCTHRPRTSSDGP